MATILDSVGQEDKSRAGKQEALHPSLGSPKDTKPFWRRVHRRVVQGYHVLVNEPASSHCEQFSIHTRRASFYREEKNEKITSGYQALASSLQPRKNVCVFFLLSNLFLVDF